MCENIIGSITLIPTGDKTYAVYEGWYEAKELRYCINNCKIFANINLNEEDINKEIIPTDDKTFQIWKKAENYLSYKNTAERYNVSIAFLINITMLKILVKALKVMYKSISLYEASNFIAVDKMKHNYNIVIKSDLNEKNYYELVKRAKKPKKIEFGKHVRSYNFNLINETDTISTMPEQNIINILCKDIGIYINNDIKQYILDKIKKIKTTSWKTESKCMTDIADQIKNIKDDGGNANIILVSLNTYHSFSSVCIKMYGNMIIVNCNVPNDVVYIYDRSIITVGNGPILFKFFRNPSIGEHFMEICKYVEPKILENLGTNRSS